MSEARLTRSLGMASGRPWGAASGCLGMASGWRKKRKGARTGGFKGGGAEGCGFECQQVPVLTLPPPVGTHEIGGSRVNDGGTADDDEGVKWRMQRGRRKRGEGERRGWARVWGGARKRRGQRYQEWTEGAGEGQHGGRCGGEVW